VTNFITNNFQFISLFKKLSECNLTINYCFNNLCSHQFQSYVFLQINQPVTRHKQIFAIIFKIFSFLYATFLIFKVVALIDSGAVILHLGSYGLIHTRHFGIQYCDKKIILSHRYLLAKVSSRYFTFFSELTLVGY